MRCDDAMSAVDAYADGEFRGWAKWRLHRHLRACPGCAARLDEAMALKARIRAEVPRYAAPASLRARVSQLSEPPAASARPVERRWRWTAAGAFAGSVATIVVWLAVAAVTAQRSSDDVALAAVDAHTRATLDQALVQVASSDQHTVKPWLSSRLDYSPPVVDYAADGFALVGARIDRLQDRPVATLVYRYRLHTVDVYVRPEGSGLATSAPKTIRGFNVVPLRGRGMEWLVVSDASPQSLAPLIEKLGSQR